MNKTDLTVYRNRLGGEKDFSLTGCYGWKILSKRFSLMENEWQIDP